MKYVKLGEFEEIVLLAVCGLKTDAYVVAVQQRIAGKTGRSATMGAIYTALDRLEDKHYVQSALGKPSPHKGGRRKRFYRITDSGLRALQEVQAMRERLWEDINPEPSPDAM